MKSRSLFAIACCFFTMSVMAQRTVNGNFPVSGTTREYMVHLPAGYSAGQHLPVVFVFHGGGSNYRQIQRYMKMDEIGDVENFISVYPNGINKQWNDGREFKASISENDDVLFIKQLLDTVIKNYSVDTKRVFATGISNGGFFSIYLSYKLSDLFLAVAPVCATIPEKIYDEFHPAVPISVLLINGTKDPLVPYNGGTVGNKMIGARGNCVSTDKTIGRYIADDKTTSTPVTENIPDAKDDGCTAVRYTYTGGEKNTTVSLIKVTNGGHALPGGAQYLPKFMIGKACEDFNGNEMIWQFFKNCKPR